MTTERRTVSNPTGAPKTAELPQPGTPQHRGYQPTPEEAASERLARQSFYLAHLMQDELWDWQKAMRPDAGEEVALLRCLTRRSLEFGDPREVANLVRLTLSALKLQADLSGTLADRAREEAFERVLIQLGEAEEARRAELAAQAAPHPPPPTEPLPEAPAPHPAIGHRGGRDGAADELSLDALGCDDLSVDTPGEEEAAGDPGKW